MKVKRFAEFSLKMHQKRLARWGAYSAPRALWLDLMDRGRE